MPTSPDTTLVLDSVGDPRLSMHVDCQTLGAPNKCVSLMQGSKRCAIVFLCYVVLFKTVTRSAILLHSSMCSDKPCKTYKMDDADLSRYNLVSDSLTNLGLSMPNPWSTK